MEFCDKGDLFQKISHCKKADTRIEESDIWSTLIQILYGLKALHDKKVLHRDLKSANIFLCKNGSVKVGDMNVSKVAKKGLLYTQTGTPYYASPEVWKDQPYDLKSDIWSLGCIIYEMAALQPPFRAENMEGLYKKVIKGQYDRLPQGYSKELTEAIRMMLQLNPSSRADCERLLSQPFIIDRLSDRLRVDVQEEERHSQLLETIRVPANPLFISEVLPQSNYEQIRVSKAVPIARAVSIDALNTKRLHNVYVTLEVDKRGPQGQEMAANQDASYAKMKLPAIVYKPLGRARGESKENQAPENAQQFQRLRNLLRLQKPDEGLVQASLEGKLDALKRKGRMVGRALPTRKVKLKKNIRLEPIVV